MPKLHHLRESGSIEQDADVVMILHRERSARTGMFTADKCPALAIAKGRMDETSVFLLDWDPQRVVFSDCKHGTEDGYPARYEDVYGI